MTGATFTTRDLEVHRPYEGEIPLDLLRAGGLGEETGERWLAAEILRIAKLGVRVVGVYAMDRGDGVTYCLHGVVVDAGHRHQGLGRWLIGHAIGVAESKGGRGLLVPHGRARRFFAQIGFVDDPGGQRFDLIPE